MPVYLSLLISAVVTPAVLFITLRNNSTISTRRLKTIGAVWTVIATLLAFFTVPLEGMDLQRYYDMLRSVQEMSIVRMFSDFEYSATPLTVFLFWFVSRTKVFNLLPAISTFIICTIMTHNLCVINKKYTLSRGAIFFSLYLWMITASPIMILTGVRQHLAFAFLSVAVVRMFVENKRNFITLLFIIIPLLIHVGSSPMCLLTLFFLLSKTKKKRHIFVAIILFAGVFYLFNNVNVDNAYFNYVKYKLTVYMDLEYSDIRKFILECAFVIVLFIMYFAFDDQLKKNKQLEFCSYSLSLLFLSALFINIPHLSSRILTYVVSVSPLFFGIIITNRRQREITKGRRDFSCLTSGLTAIYVYGTTAYVLVALSHLWQLSLTIYR